MYNVASSTGGEVCGLVGLYIDAAPGAGRVRLGLHLHVGPLEVLHTNTTL